MTLLDLIKEQIENKYKYNFVIFYNGKDVINTYNQMTFRKLQYYIGFDLGNIEVVSYKIHKSKIIHIKLKDS